MIDPLKIKRIDDLLKPVAGEDSRFEARQLVYSTDDQIELEHRALRRQQGEPLQYILGEWEFYGLPMKVDPNVLIPRADTETLCELAIKRITDRGYKSVLDLCTGSGCIGIAIKKHTDARVILADISPEALALAGKNAELNGADTMLIRSDLFSSIEGTFDCIVINPPYLSRADMDSLQREVRFEPSLALFGGDDGLDFYRRIAADYKKHLAKGGTLCMEIGYNQAQSVLAMFDNGEVYRDCCGKDRVIIVEELCSTN